MKKNQSKEKKKQNEEKGIRIPFQSKDEKIEEILQCLDHFSETDKKSYLKDLLKRERRTVFYIIDTVIFTTCLVFLILLAISGNYIQNEIVVVEVCDGAQVNQSIDVGELIKQGYSVNLEQIEEKKKEEMQNRGIG